MQEVTARPCLRLWEPAEASCFLSSLLFQFPSGLPTLGLTMILALEEPLS